MEEQKNRKFQELYEVWGIQRCRRLSLIVVAYRILREGQHVYTKKC